MTDLALGGESSDWESRVAKKIAEANEIAMANGLELLNFAFRPLKSPVATLSGVPIYMDYPPGATDEQTVVYQTAHGEAEAEKARKAAEALGAAPVTVQACRPEDRFMLATPAGVELVAAAAASLRADEPATLSLGAICGRLGFNVSAAFLLDVLHIRHSKTDGRALLYTESQFQLICPQIAAHVSAMAELYVVEKV